jgi:hypothetical protein
MVTVMTRKLTESEKYGWHEIVRNLSPKSAVFVQDEIAPHFELDERLKKKLNVAHLKAIADGHEPESEGYFRSAKQYLGAPGDKRQVRVLAEGKRPDPSDPNQLSKGEYVAATETVCWGRENPDKCGQPIGVEEYIKRRDAIRKDPRWVRLDG